MSYDLFPTPPKSHATGSVKALYESLEIIQQDKSLGATNLTTDIITLQSNPAKLKDVQARSTSIYEQLKERTKVSHPNITDAQLRAGVYATMLSANPKEFMNTPLRQPGSAETRVMNQGIPKNRMSRIITNCSYNESDFRKNSHSSVTYSMGAASQDALGNLFFKPIAFDPLTTGIEVDISIVNLFNNFYRSTTGSLTNFHRKNLLEAYVNPEIVRNDTTRMIPVFRETGNTKNNHCFADKALIPEKVRRIGAGITVRTNALKIGKEFELLGISQRDEMIAGGHADFTDAISPVIRLETLYIKVGDDMLPINTYELRDSLFFPAPQGRTTKVTLNFDNDSVTFPAGTKSVTEDSNGDRKDLVTLAGFKDYDIRVRVHATGNIVLDTGTSSVKDAGVQFVNATDKDGKLLTGAKAEELAKLFEDAEVYGYDIEARFDNWNIRNLGLLVENQHFKVLYNVPYLSPVSSIVTTYDNENETPQVLNDLVTVTQLTSAHAAIAKLRSIEGYLENYVKVPDANGNMPEFHGIGGYYVKTFFKRDTFKLLDLVDSTESHNRDADIKAALWGRIHYRAMRMILDSEYLPAAYRIKGDNNYKPTVIIGTDPMIESYLFGEGEGDVIPKRKQYNVKVESSLSALAVGKLWMSLADNANSTTDTTLCPLSLGNFLTGADVIARHDRSWNGQISNTLTTTPRYLHVWNLPIMTVMHIEDIEAITGKIHVNVNVI